VCMYVSVLCCVVAGDLRWISAVLQLPEVCTVTLSLFRAVSMLMQHAHSAPQIKCEMKMLPVSATAVLAVAAHKPLSCFALCVLSGSILQGFQTAPPPLPCRGVVAVVSWHVGKEVTHLHIGCAATWIKLQPHNKGMHCMAGAPKTQPCCLELFWAEVRVLVVKNFRLQLKSQ